MKIRSLVLILALLAAPEALSAQRSSEDSRSERHGPVEMLLRRRERIGLSDEQVARLEEIGRRMEERNRPLVARLLEMRRRLRADFPRDRDDMDEAQRKAYRRRVKAARPLLREIRENNREAMREVGDLLTPDQKDLVRRMLRDRHDDDDDRDGRKGRGDGRRRRGGGQ